MKSDLAGQRFGRLTVLAPTEERRRGAVVWQCRCDCGRTVLMESLKLKPWLNLNCGSCAGDTVPADLTGLRFGKLTVLEKSERRTKSRNALWRCQCDCGAQIETTRAKLLSGSTSSCGCGRQPPLKDWVGRRFGKLVVVSYAGREKGCHLWRCRCDCGNEVTVRQSNLQDGCSTSCGCSHDPTAAMHFVEGTCIELIRSKHLSKANTSGVRGVYFNKRKGKWVAQIMFKGKNHYLGAFDTLENAARARSRGEELFEDFLTWYDSQPQMDAAEKNK